jgi:hypothetical protein
MTGQDHRGRTTLKLLRRIEGSALLIANERELQVQCAGAEYEARDRTTVTGSLEGDLSWCADGDDAVLRLPDEMALQVRLIEPDEEGADFRSV